MFQIIRHDTNYPFTRLMKPALILSAVLILLSIGTVVMRGGLNYGIDFVGGTIVEIKFQAPVDIAAVRAALGPAGFGGAEIKHFGSPSEVLISTEQSSTSVEGVEKADPRRSRQPLERAVRRAAPRDGRPEGRRRPAQQGDLVAGRLLGADARATSPGASSSSSRSAASSRSCTTSSSRSGSSRCSAAPSA